MARSRRNDPLLAQIQESLLDRIDRRLAVILGASVAIHVGIAAYAWSADLEQPVHLPAPPVATTYQDVMDVVIPDLAAPPLAPPSHAGVATPTAITPSMHRIVHPTTLTASNPGVVDPQQLAGMLTGNADETPRARPDLGTQIIDARDGHYTIGEGTHTSRVDERANIGTRDETPITSDPTLTHAPDTHHEGEPHGRIIPGSVKPDSSTSLTPALVLDRIQSEYMAGLQRCYRLGLAADSELSGKVAIKLTVDERGQVTDPEASGVSSGVDSCISEQMSRWRFPVPKDKDGSPTDVSFAISLALQSS